MEAPEALDGQEPGGFGLNGAGQMPTLDEIMAFIDQASALSDEEKAEIKADVLKYREDMDAGIQDATVTTVAAAAGGILAPQNLVFIGLVILIALIIGFFVYKIIKVQKQKELTRELKRQAKEQRKNKAKKS